MPSLLDDMIRLASETENTPELHKYWEQRYKEAQDKNLFRVSNKTLDLLAVNKIIARPTTTHAELLICNHLDPQNNIRENLLQDTIETLVRLMDALLDKINFTPEASNIVKQYRKIAIGIGDLDNYFVRTSSASPQETINYLGNFISTKAYRASESLAEEKGQCNLWANIKQILRPKSFELWYNRQTGEIKNGLDLTQDFTQETIQTSDFEIIPRRNSNLLLFPQNPEWSAWIDRDQGLVKNTDKENHSSSIASSNVQNDVITATETLFQLGELVQIRQTDSPRNGDILQIIEIQKQDSQTQYRLSDGKAETEETLWQESSLSIVELSGLLETLNTVKHKQAHSELVIENWSRALFIDSDKKSILVEKTENGYHLPGVQILKNQVPEKVLLRYLTENYQFEGEIYEEIGSAITIGENDLTPSQIHLGFLVDSQHILFSDNHFWLPLNSENLPRYILVLLDKFSKKQESANLLSAKIDQTQLEKQNLESEIKQLKAEIEKLTPKYDFSSQTTHREYKPEILAKAIGSLSKYVLKLEQLVQFEDFGEMLLTLTYDGCGPRIVDLKGNDLNSVLQQTLELFLELINFILINNIDPKFICEKLNFSNKEHIQLPIKLLLQFIGESLKVAPERVQEIDTNLIEAIEAKKFEQNKNV